MIPGATSKAARIDPALAWAYYALDPVAFCEDQLHVKLDPWQVAVLRALADPSTARVMVRSCHGPGKTRVAACLILWFGLTQGRSRIPCTAPKLDSLTEKLWPEIAKVLLGAEPEIRAAVEWQATRLVFFGQPGWAAHADTAAHPEGLAGHHENRVLAVVEEASGVDETFWPVLEGALTTAGSKLLAISNPTRDTGTFARAFRRNRPGERLFQVGWAPTGAPGVLPVNPLKPYRGRSDTGAVVEVWYSDRPDAKWALDQIANYGWDSNIVRVRVRGLPPLAGDDALLSGHYVWQAYGRKALEADIIAPMIWSWDVAGAGRDRSIVSSRRGTLVQSIMASPDANLHEQAMKLGDLIGSQRPDQVNIDCIGVGAGPVDTLSSLGFGITPVNVGRPSSDEQFANLRAELYWKLRQDFLNGTIALSNTIPEETIEALAEELGATKWGMTPNGKIRIMPKDDIKKAIGRSPDIADSLMLHYASMTTGDSFGLVGETEASLADW